MLQVFATRPRRAFAVLLVFAAPFIAASALAQEAPDLRALRLDVAYLASDLLEGRASGSPGEALAAAYIADRFAELGLSPGGSDGSWMQPFSFHVSANPHAAAGEGQAYTARNIVGVLDHGAPHTVVIGAHYDHLGYGGAGSRQPGDSLIHNGADDNASGVAGLLAIAHRLQASPARGANYVFVAFSGEEMGLHGSKYFVQHPPVPLERITYMINLDMVGRLDSTRTLAVNGTGTSPAWEAVLDAAAEATGLTLARHASGLGPSDHASFYLEDIPVLHLFTGQHAEYHKPGDDSQHINYAGLSDVSAFAVHVIEALDGSDKLAFTKTQDESENRVAAFKVSLGVMPDYVHTGEGMRIDAVLDDRPAARAGLERGDVIVQIGDMEVKDIYAYMEALSKFEAGATTTLVFMRGEERMEAEVTF